MLEMLQWQLTEIGLRKLKVIFKNNIKKQNNNINPKVKMKTKKYKNIWKFK